MFPLHFQFSYLYIYFLFIQELVNTILTELTLYTFPRAFAEPQDPQPDI